MKQPHERFRAFSIVAHIDHGKSTLADRMLELCGAVDPRDMRAQYLDSMELERERGITIKAQNVRLTWKDHVLHLIDTPGHVDFGYEVSRSLAACEGAVLLADAVHDAEEIGVRLPAPTPVASLGPGEVGYLIAGIKDVGQARVGETVTTAARPGAPLPGYRNPKPMVFCGLYPIEGDDYT